MLAAGRSIIAAGGLLLLTAGDLFFFCLSSYSYQIPYKVFSTTN